MQIRHFITLQLNSKGSQSTRPQLDIYIIALLAFAGAIMKVKGDILLIPY